MSATPASPSPASTSTAANDEAAARAVAAGGGMQAVVDATGLRTRENVLAVIDRRSSIEPTERRRCTTRPRVRRAQAEPDNGSAGRVDKAVAPVALRLVCDRERSSLARGWSSSRMNSRASPG